MKRTFTMIWFLSIFIFTAYNSNAFELNGFWKSDQKYPLNVIQFDEAKFHYGKFKFEYKIEHHGSEIVVTFVGGDVKITPDNDNSIRVTYPNPAFPQNIVYTRINEDEAKQLINQED